MQQETPNKQTPQTWSNELQTQNQICAQIMHIRFSSAQRVKAEFNIEKIFFFSHLNWNLQ